MDDWNTGWDPYQELQQAQANIHQLVVSHNNAHNHIQRLIKSHNQHDQLLLDISQQHTQLVELLKQARREIDSLKTELAMLKNQSLLIPPN